MSDVNVGAPHESSRLKPVLIASVVLAVIAVAVFYLNPRKTAEITVSNVQVYSYAASAAVAKGAGNVIGETVEGEKDFYVVATVHFENKLRLPLFIDRAFVTYIGADGSTKTGQVSAVRDVERLEEIFPSLKLMLPKPWNMADTIEPGSTKEGQVLIEFPGFTEALWNQRRAATITFNLMHQAPVTASLP